MTFRYPVPKDKKDDSQKVETISPLEAEVLTGFVKGKIASDGEERVAIGLNEAGMGFAFQFPVDTRTTLPDKAKMVDFVVYKGGRVHPLEFYGEYWHSTAADKSRDARRKDELNEVFHRWGWEKLKIIREHEAYDQDTVNARLRYLFI